VRRWRDLRGVLRREWRHILVAELLFAAALALYVWHKAHDPAINHTEEPMDFAFLNGILRSPSFPPRDPWMAGQSISYYYLGYLTVAVMTRLTGLPSGVGYNLGLAHTFALTVVGGYGLIAALTGGASPADGRARRWPGVLPVLGGLGIPLLSNLVGPLELLRALGIGSQRFYAWLAVPGLADAPSGGGALPAGAWWWWRASRVALDTNLLGRMPTLITEFPAFSFLLGDLHPHVMALPYATLAIACAIVLYHWHAGDHASTTRLARIGSLAFVAWMLGALGFLNSWDLPTYLALSLLAYAWGAWRAFGLGRRWLARLLFVTLCLGAGSLLFYGPFWARLSSQAQGLGLVYYTKLSLRHYGLCLGLWLVPLSALTLSRWRSGARQRTRALWLWLALLLLPWLMTLALGGPGRLLIGLGVWIGKGPWLLLLLSAWLAALLWLLLEQPRKDYPAREHDMVWLLALLGLGLTYVAEFFYLRDLFDTRMNTVFKVYYQAWLLLGVAALAGLSALWRRGRWGRASVWLSAALCLAALYYPVAAAYTRAGGYQGQAQLDGTAYLLEQSPAEYRAYRWLDERAGPEGVVLEAVGEEYVPWTSRLSAWTGVPTVLGWPGHQVQWRGEDREVKRRQADVAAMYTATDPDELLRLLRAYHVTWVFVGPYERETYGLDADRLSWFDQVLTIDLMDAGIRLYRVPVASSPVAGSPAAP
jgi:YYY domain-containing protein